MGVPTVKLNNGYSMPVLGLGTAAAKGRQCVEAVLEAIDAGYRHFDTAFVYDTERDVGEAIRTKIADGSVTRDEIFLVTKLWCTYHEPERVEEICKKQLEALKLDYIDLYLMHFPVGFVYHNDQTPWPKNPDGSQETNGVDYIDTWKAMEQLVKKGLVRSIGISNFNSEQIERLLKVAEIKPVTNQVECNPLINQRKLIKFCEARDIVITAYSPVARANVEKKTPAFLFDAKMVAIAEKYKKTTAQVTLRYLVQLGTIPIPKSVTKERIQQNIDVFDFELTEDEMKVMDSFNANERWVKLSDCKGHKYWPFALEF